MRKVRQQVVGTMLGLVVVCAGVFAPSAAWGEEASGITVTGMGQVMVKPDALEIVGTIQSEAELAADAIQKYEQTAAAVIKAVEGLQIDGLRIERGGFEIGPSMPNQRMMMAGGQGNESAASMAVSERMTIRIPGIQQMESAKLLENITAVLDAGQDAGLSVGMDMSGGMEMYILSQMMGGGGGDGGPVRFTVANPKDARRKAYKAAMEDAREKAQTLAALAEVELGKVRAITEQVGDEAKSEPPSGRMAAIMGLWGMGGPSSDERTSSSTFGEIALRATLSVTYEVK